MDSIKSYLKIHNWARERKNKDVAILNLLAQNERYLEFMKTLPTNLLVDFVKDYSNLNRYWRKVTEENEDLRGSDYNDKEKLQEQTELSLGYEVGYNQDIKLASKIK